MREAGRLSQRSGARRASHLHARAFPQILMRGSIATASRNTLSRDACGRFWDPDSGYFLAAGRGRSSLRCPFPPPDPPISPLRRGSEGARSGIFLLWKSIFLGTSGAPLEMLAPALGTLMAPLGRLGTSLGTLEAPLGSSGASLGTLMASLGRQGASLGTLKAALGTSAPFLGRKTTQPSPSLSPRHFPRFSPSSQPVDC